MGNGCRGTCEQDGMRVVFRASVLGFNQNIDPPEFLEGWKNGRMEGREGNLSLLCFLSFPFILFLSLEVKR